MASRVRLLIAAGVGLAWALAPHVTFGQNLAVQQPIVGAFGVSTTVVAPDSGGAFVGRSARGASSASRYGFSPFGSTFGRDYGTGSMSTHVLIHDFTEMEDRLLAGQAGPRMPVLTGHAARAYAHLRQQTPASRLDSEIQVEVPDIEAPPRPTEQDYLAKGRAALAAGKADVAKVYLRLAVSKGSAEAAAELTRAHTPRKLAQAAAAK